MNNLLVRKIIREEVKRKVAHNMFGRDFEYLISESSLNEFDMSTIDLGGLLKSGAGFIEKNLGQAGIDSVKQMIIEGIFSFLDDAEFPISKDSLMGSVLINVIQNLTAADMADYFTDGGCEKIVDRILAGVQDGLVQKVVLDKILETLMGPGAKLEGIIGSPIRELISLKLKDMTAYLRDPLVAFACKHRDFKKLLGSLTAGSTSRSSTSTDIDDETDLTNVNADTQNAEPVRKTLIRMRS